MGAILITEGPDAGVPWHFGDPLREQRLLDEAGTAVDLSHRGVITVSGPDRLGWLHSLTTQYLDGLAPGVGVTTLVLSPQGHIEHALYGVDDGETFWAHTEPGAAAAAAAWLDRMRFMMRVEVADRTAEYAVVWRSGPSTGPSQPVDWLRDARAGRTPWAVTRSSCRAPSWLDALAGTPAGRDCGRTRPGGSPPACRGSGWTPTTAPSPTSSGCSGPAVHLDKGCYRGQETVARVHTLGRPPRRLVRLHLDGSAETLPAAGAPLELDGRAVGFVGGSARHYELGPIALGLVKRNVDPDGHLDWSDGIARRSGAPGRPRDRAARPAPPVSSPSGALERRPRPGRGRPQRLRRERPPRAGGGHRTRRCAAGLVGRRLRAHVPPQLQQAAAGRRHGPGRARSAPGAARRGLRLALR